MTHGRVDASDLFRAALVQAIAAVDAYVHGIVLDRAVDMLMGRLQSHGSNARVGLPFGAIQAVMSAGTEAERELEARSQIAQRLALETFQRPDAIAAAFSMVGIPRIWKTAFPGDPGAAKAALGVIVDRRNRIVHACDIDPLNPGTVTALSSADAVDAIATVERLTRGIDSHC